MNKKKRRGARLQNKKRWKDSEDLLVSLFLPKESIRLLRNVLVTKPASIESEK